MPTKQFSEVISGLGEGDLDGRMTDRLAELVQKVDETGGDGTITLTLKVQKMNRQVVFKPKFKVQLPEPAVDDTMFFVDKDGGLTRDDPKQLPLRGVPGKNPKVHAINGGKTDDNDPNKKDGN